MKKKQVNKLGRLYYHLNKITLEKSVKQTKEKLHNSNKVDKMVGWERQTHKEKNILVSPPGCNFGPARARLYVLFAYLALGFSSVAFLSLKNFLVEN